MDKKMSEIRDAEAEKRINDSVLYPATRALKDAKGMWLEGFDCRDKLDNEALKIAIEALEFFDGVHRLHWAIDLNNLPTTAERVLAEINKIVGTK